MGGSPGRKTSAVFRGRCMLAGSRVALLCFALLCVCVCAWRDLKTSAAADVNSVIEPLLPMVPAVLVIVAVMPAVVSARRPENCHWPRGTELIKYLVHVQVDPGSSTTALSGGSLDSQTAAQFFALL